ncbi:MAG: 3-methyl-2-oxobutanoate dehydrogenase subunit VorB [Vicinamibacteria bacterium]|nr:3-methyl-2-oxobutanoate dehydrogenase subunit VorB [Vicinamibacteria bacterium]
MAKKSLKAKPLLSPQYCKACGLCVEACAQGCLVMGEAIHPETGLRPVVLDIERCTACGLCISACPEPYALAPLPVEGETEIPAPPPKAALTTPDTRLPLAIEDPLVIRGTYASAIGALLAGCRNFFGYPITPSTEGAELMALLLPKLDGVFVQAVSELATINMMYGCGGAGRRAMTFTSSPGMSLMLEGLSYMIGAEIPGVVVDVMRGGPGLGNIAPEQSDIKLVCRSLGHGNTHGIVLAPSTPQEMLDLTFDAFELSFRYRIPAVVLCDGYLGQMTGRVVLPKTMVRPGVPGWAVTGDREHRRNLMCSIELSERDLEEHNRRLIEKYKRIEKSEQRADLFHCDDAEVILVACNTPARMAKGAVRELRQRGAKVGLFRPLTLWPFPIQALEPVVARARRIVVVEASDGQLEDELRLALSHAGMRLPARIESLRHYGGVLPQLHEIVDVVLPDALSAGASRGRA